jgi:hypothetical protein
MVKYLSFRLETFFSLSVSKHYVLKYENEEREKRFQAETQVFHHIGTLDNLRGRLEAKRDFKIRSANYREWQKSFNRKKWAVMQGKTLDEVEHMDRVGSQRRGKLPKSENTIQASSTTTSDLSNVLNSLHKLAKLEKRITLLEQNNIHDKSSAARRVSASERTSFSFLQSAKSGTNGSKQLIYTIQPKNGRRMVAGGAINAVRHNRELSRKAASIQSKNEGKSEIFLTAGSQDVAGEKIYAPTRQQHAFLRRPMKKRYNQAENSTTKPRTSRYGCTRRRHDDTMTDMVRRKRSHNSGRMNNKQSDAISRVRRPHSLAGTKFTGERKRNAHHSSLQK